MYNRYVPGHDGSYRRHTVAEPEKCPPPSLPVEVSCEEHPTPPPKKRPVHSQTAGIDIGDLLLLCIVALLLIDSEEEDSVPLLIMAAVFLLSQ